MKKYSFCFFLFCLLLQSIQLKSQNFEWAKIIGGFSDQDGRGITVDADGNVYTTGFYDSIADLDPGAGVLNYNAGGSIGCYIQKLDSLGNLVWAKTVYGPWGCWGNAIKLDTSGNICISGGFSGTVDFDPGAGTYNLTGISLLGQDLFILKLDVLGNFVWAKNIGGGGVSNVAAMDIDVFGNTYIAGLYSDSIDIDPGAGVLNLFSNGVWDILVIKLDVLGNLAWGKSFGGSDYDGGQSIAIDTFGNVYSTGSYRGTVDFDPGPGTFNLMSVASNSDIYVQKLDSSGNFLWAKSMGGIGLDEGGSIVADASGNIYLTGTFSETSDFDPGAGSYNLTAAGTPSLYDIFIEKLNSSGNFVWAKSIEGIGSDFGKSIAIDNSGYIYLTGYFDQMADFDPGPGVVNITPTIWDDIFVEKLDPSGNFVWVRNVGSTSIDEGHALTVDLSGNVYVTGNFQATADFDPNTGTFYETSVENRDAFVMKWSQDICANVALVIDSASGITCSTIGFASSYTLGGLAPYSYSWNTTPVVNDSIISFASGGIYQLIVTDANSCVRSTSLLVNAPTYFSDFDLNANMHATSFRPGFATVVWLDGFNDGCVATSGTLKLLLDNMVTYNSAIPSPDAIVGDTLIWNFSSITYDSGHIVPSIVFTTDTTASFGSNVCFDLIMNPVFGDADSSNNVKNYCFEVLNGYDPNDKKVYPKGECNEGYVLNNQVLTYIIRFQNTGNSDAINIFVLDSLDADLDLNSLRVIGNSHSLITEILPGNVLKFRFDNILLPDSTSNEIGSHGYVVFEISPLPGLSNGTTIKNKAEIYFDFNPAVVTNFVANTIIDILPSSLISGVTQSGNILTSTETGVTYQWINCSNNQPIVGATNQSYTATANGNYAVTINNGGCSVTSVCYNVSTIGINENDFSSSMLVYPNPSEGDVTIDFGNVYDNIIVEVRDVFGRLVSTKKAKQTSQTNIEIDGVKGMYFLTIQINKQKAFLKVVKK